MLRSAPFRSRPAATWLLLAASGLAQHHAAAEIVPRPTSEPYPLRPIVSLGATAVCVPARLRGATIPAGEIWRSDGTPGGTVRLRDLRGEGVLEGFAWGGGAFLSAHTPAAGWELFWTDGTAAGTLLVRDVRPGPAGSIPRAMGAAGGRFLFAADDGVHGRELWASDGTRAGTRLLADLWPGPRSGLPAADDLWRDTGRLGGAILFAASDPVHGRELWRSDGTTAGTRLVRDLWPGPLGGLPRAFVRAGARVHFVARTPATGGEPWSTDGSGPGTRLSADLSPGPATSMPDPFGAAGGGMVLGAHDGHERSLWWTAGDGAHRLGAARPRDEDPHGPALHASCAGRVVFAGRGGGFGLEPWGTDGTAEGTTLLADIAVAAGSVPGWFTAAGDLAFFLAWRDTNHELWRTDGTPGGTLPLELFPQGGPDGLTPAIAAGGLHLFALERTGVHGQLERVELWRSDGTPDGTGPVLPSP